MEEAEAGVKRKACLSSKTEQLLGITWHSLAHLPHLLICACSACSWLRPRDKCTCESFVVSLHLRHLRHAFPRRKSTPSSFGKRVFPCFLGISSLWSVSLAVPLTCHTSEDALERSSIYSTSHSHCSYGSVIAFLDIAQHPCMQAGSLATNP
jgi:hypothetical protein